MGNKQGWNLDQATATHHRIDPASDESCQQQN